MGTELQTDKLKQLLALTESTEDNEVLLDIIFRIDANDEKSPDQQTKLI